MFEVETIAGAINFSLMDLDRETTAGLDKDRPALVVYYQEGL